MAQSFRIFVRKLTRVVTPALLALPFWAPAAHAAPFPATLKGTWFTVSSGWVYKVTPVLNDRALSREPTVALTGGRAFHTATFELPRAEEVVIDFKNTNTIGHFHHWIFDAKGVLRGEADGGMLSAAPDPFFLTHGREFRLPAGRYRLVTEVSSPFYIAQPEPYIDTLTHYRQAIKPPAALALFCLGTLFGLGIYYSTLALLRGNLAEGMYATFIAGNLIFDSAALLALEQLAGVRSFALLGLPLLLSNAAYVVFVMALLNIRQATHPRLHRAGLVLLGVMGLTVGLALLMPHWALELERIGVALFLLFGLAAGIVCSREGSMTARFYLAAISLFFVVGGITISVSNLRGIYTLHVEHLGILAVTIEALALALVLSYQFAQLRREKEAVLGQHVQSMRQARTDALTGLPNRLALEEDLSPVPARAALTFIDMDGLKLYNDRYGHDRGDALLRTFSGQLGKLLEGPARIYRLGGDEFAIVEQEGSPGGIADTIEAAIAATRARGFEEAGASYGTAHANETDGREKLMHIADKRMYQHKHSKRDES